MSLRIEKVPHPLPALRSSGNQGHSSGSSILGCAITQAPDARWRWAPLPSSRCKCFKCECILQAKAEPSSAASYRRGRDAAGQCIGSLWTQMPCILPGTFRICQAQPSDTPPIISGVKRKLALRMGQGGKKALLSFVKQQRAQRQAGKWCGQVSCLVRGGEVMRGWPRSSLPAGLWLLPATGG